MLTGLYPPSSGTILINGRDMETDLKAIQAEMGVCPQYDVLFDTLTVQEHLLLYGSVKCPLWTKGQLHQQVSRWVILLNLAPDANCGQVGCRSHVIQVGTAGG